MPQRERILVLGGPTPNLAAVLDGADVVRADGLADAVARLRDGPGVTAVVADPSDPAVLDEARRLSRAGRVLDALDDGVAALDAEFRVTYANPAFRGMCDADPVGRPFADAVGPHEFAAPEGDPLAAARSGRPAAGRMAQPRPGRTFEVRVLPDAAAGPRAFTVICHDVTRAVQQQQQLDALHRAGQELAALTRDELADMTVEDRVAILKANMLRSIHELLHYDRVEIRLLNPQTGRLTSLLAEGMTEQAENRVLHARETGNGVTGLVAATGKSYLCRETAGDPHYIEGVAGARSSLTVPLIAHDRVIGTFNVESLSPDAFSPDDLRFTEIFSREIATALNTLELLSAQHDVTAVRSVEAVAREVALPLDEMLCGASRLLGRVGDLDPEAAEQLRRLAEAARRVREGLRRASEELSPPGADDPALARLRGKRVLVADADERVRRSAHAILGRYRCLVDTAGSGTEAVALARSNPYDTLIADIRLPDMSGYEAYRQLRQARPEGRVVLMTAFGYDASHSIVKARQDGLRFVLFKPFRLEQLIDALTSADPPPAVRPAGPPPVLRA